MGAEPRDLVATQARDLEWVPMGLDQTACTMLPRSNRPVENARCRKIESAEKPAA